MECPAQTTVKQINTHIREANILRYARLLLTFLLGVRKMPVSFIRFDRSKFYNFALLRSLGTIVIIYFLPFNL